jgi:hypothetical protein
MIPPQIRHLEHGILHRGENWYCGHPRQVLFTQFGDGELVVGHNHAPCIYSSPEDVRHDLGGYHSRAIALLQRSIDGRIFTAYYYNAPSASPFGGIRFIASSHFELTI